MAPCAGRASASAAACLVLLLFLISSARANRTSDKPLPPLPAELPQPNITFAANARTTATITALSRTGLYATRSFRVYRLLRGRASYVSSHQRCAVNYRVRLSPNGGIAIACPTAAGVRRGGSSVQRVAAGTARSFFARYVIRTGFTGSTVGESQGYLYISGGRIFMEIYNAASNILTANINGTPFGANAYSAWYAIVELQRIGA